MHKLYPLLLDNPVSTDDNKTTILTRDTLYNKYLFVISVDEPEQILIHPFSKKYKHNNMVNNVDVICAGEINICKDNFELECKDKLNDLNSLCNDLHMKMQGINLNIGISDIIPTSTSNNMGGTSIEDLLKQRQCEEIEQIIIDSIDIKPDIMIDDVQY